MKTKTEIVQKLLEENKIDAEEAVILLIGEYRDDIRLVPYPCPYPVYPALPYVPVYQSWPITPWVTTCSPQPLQPAYSLNIN